MFILVITHILGVTRVCGSILYDGEIMAGWTAEHRNLNIICPFCKEKTVPSLVTMVTDLRSSPPVSQSESSSKSCDPLSSQSQRSHPLQSYQPVKHKPISVPYLSPLVLRKVNEDFELEYQYPSKIFNNG